MPASDGEYPALGGRSGTRRARGGNAHGSGGGRPHFSNLPTIPAWIRSLISPVAHIIPRIFRIMDISAVTARTVQGMARVRSGQAPAWPLVSDRSVRSGLQGQARLRVYVDQCLSTCTGCLAAQSRLRLEGRTRTLSGPSPDLTSSVSGLLRGLAHVRQARSPRLLCYPGVAGVTLGRPPHRARGGHGPLRPETRAPLGFWPSSQLAQCAADRPCWRLCGDVAVLPCCTVRRISSSGRGRPDPFKLDQRL